MPKMRRVFTHGNISQYTCYTVTDKDGDNITINIAPDMTAIVDINEEAAIKLDKLDLRALKNMLDEISEL